MVDHPTWPSLTGAQWQQRIREAAAIGERWAFPESDAESEAQAQTWLASVNATAYVGARHHTVPRFLLWMWGDSSGQVQVYHRVEDRRGLENVRDLAIRDFYTIIDVDGHKNSTFESLLGQVEVAAKPFVEAIISPFGLRMPLGVDAILSLGQLAAFQSIRTARHRRELELQAEWYAKTMVAGRVEDDELQQIVVVPHQNETIELSMKAAEKLMPFFICRPLAVIHLDAPMLYMCDEPIVLNAPDGDFHAEDCLLTDEEIAARNQRRMRKTRKRRRRPPERPGRIVHFSSTRPSGHGTAEEVLLPISPRTALLWGPLGPAPPNGPIERVRLAAGEAVRFASMANEAMCAQALDWVISRAADVDFASRDFPPVGPLMRVCDGTNAASLAVNQTPVRFRPHRLWTPREPN